MPSGNNIQRILVYRLGSIGDFVVALPCLHLLRRRYPQAIITLLTNQPAERRAAPAEAVLRGSGLVDEFLTYPLRTRQPRELLAIRRTIRALAPDLLVYLAAPRGAQSVYRDYLFFRWCGVTRSVGFPFTGDLKNLRPPSASGGLWEREASRLARCVASLGDVRLDDVENWDLRLTPAEIAKADRLIAEARLPMNRPLIALSVGTKQAEKDWGVDNWRAVIEALGDRRIGLVLIGAGEDAIRSVQAAQSWQGPVVNCCGRLSPRESAAVLKCASVLLCPDSGPMHLAAAVGTSCIAVFSGHRPPGQWFPVGPNHRIFYPQQGHNAIMAIKPFDVARTVTTLLAERAPVAS